MTVSLLLRTFSLCILLCFSISIAYSQGDTCIEFQEFCPNDGDSDVTFPAGVGSGNAENGNNYGCLGSTPNPAWYYIQIGQPGSLNILLTNSNNQDIDFALWGPFPTYNNALDNCGSLGSPADCSYSIAATETVSIPNSAAGEIYVLLITNFSNQPTNIIGEATGNGVPACCTVPTGTGPSCEDPTSFSCGCWTDGISGLMPSSNPGTAPPGFCGTTENQQWISFESCWCAVSIEISAENCNFPEGIEAQLFSDCNEPVSECITISDGATVNLPALSGGNEIDCEIGGTYTLLLDGVNGAICDYTIVATPVDVLPPEFIDDTIEGPTEVCEGDTVTYEFPMVLNADVCDVTFTGDAEIIDLTHNSFTVIFGDTGGTLCAIASNCAGTSQLCIEVTVFLSNDMPLTAGETIETCDDLAQFYTVEIPLMGGVAPYSVAGVEIIGSTFISDPIPAGEAYSFTIENASPCLEPITVEGQVECPCSTETGLIEDSFTELCGEDILQIEQTEAPTLDDNDVLIYALRNAAGELIASNAAGIFTYQASMNYNEVYTVCAEAGNDDGTGNPIRDYPCFVTSNCKDIVFYNDIQITANAPTELTCDSPERSLAPLIFGGSGSYELVWTDETGNTISNAEEIIVNTTGIYTITAQDIQTSCVTSFEIIITEAEEVTGLELSTIDPTCYNDTDGQILVDSVIGGVAPFLYRLNDGFFAANTEFTSQAAGDNSITIMDANGCEFTAETTLKNPAEVIVTLDLLNADNPIQLGEEANLEAITPNVITNPSIAWFINERIQADTFFTLDSTLLETAVISVIVSDENGCSAADTLRVNVEQKDPIFVPNAFSPNDDGVNDELNVFGDQSVELIDFIRIYDRWGNLLYTEVEFLPNDQSIGWNGRHRENPVGSDVYVYVLQATYIDGRSETFRGDITLVR